MAKVDGLNGLFTSKNSADVLDFYTRFKDANALIKWSRSRPHGRAKIYEVHGRKDVIVVIPTADRFGKMAKDCEETFRGQQIIFVESGGLGDQYFNYSRNCNVGMKYALKYKPKWIVVSGDDVYKIDSLDILRDGLKKLDGKRIDAVFIDPRPDYYHSYPSSIVKIRNWTMYMAYRHLRRLPYLEIDRFMRKFDSKYVLYDLNDRGSKGSIRTILMKMIFKKIDDLFTVGDFCVFSLDFVKGSGGKVFDETYINGGEDCDLSVLIRKSKRYAQINFRIGSKNGGGNSLGKGDARGARGYRDLFAFIYFNSKCPKYLKS